MGVPPMNHAQDARATRIKGAKDMKYMLMMTATKADFDWYSKWSKEDLQAQFAFMHAFNKELKDAGALVAAEGLAFPDQARIVRAGKDGEPVVTNGIVRGRGKDGAPVVIDGPFAETKEFLAGYWIVEVPSPEEAYRIAARASAAPGPGGTVANIPIEVRQVMSGPPEDLQ
jgi:hypothetical protein